ncbi:hypothetical protein C8R43DRAFT_946073 [Mycena crocata]|nr:hypothetical protein C8R43DRAFT_946073 [Mycena crocata]
MPLTTVKIEEESDNEDGTIWYCENCDPCPVCGAPPQIPAAPQAPAAAAPPVRSSPRARVNDVLRVEYNPLTVPIAFPIAVFCAEWYLLGGWRQLIIPHLIGLLFCSI